MNYLQNIFNESLVNAIGWTILHSIWQGAVVVVVVAFVLSLLKNPSSKLKYNLYTTALFAVLGCSVATFFYLKHNNSPNPSKVEWIVPAKTQHEQNDIVELVFLDENIASEIRKADTSVSAFFTDLSAMANDYMAWIVVVWMMGCVLFSIRFIGGFVYIHRLRSRNVSPVEAHWQQKLVVICEKIGVKKTIRLLESTAISTPMVIGHFKPIVLFPIGAMTGLNPLQVEAILAHELAHIYRNDYLVNILQSVAEIVLFYHPASWWLSGKMQATREHCCDDLAIRLCGDRMVYAKALTEIEYLRVQQQTPYLAAAFAGNGNANNLMARIQRLFSPSEKQFNSVDGWVASMMLVIAVLAISWTSHTKIEAAEKEVSIFIGSVMDDLKWVAEDVGDVFVELTADSTKRAEKRIKRLEKQQRKAEEKIEKQVQKIEKNVEKLVVKTKDGYVVVPSIPPVPPVPPVPPIHTVLPTPPIPPTVPFYTLPNSDILVLPKTPASPKAPLFPNAPSPPQAPVFPKMNGFYNFNGVFEVHPDVTAFIHGGPDLRVLIAEQPDVWKFIASEKPDIFYVDKDKVKFKNKAPKRVIRLKIPMSLDSIKNQELRAKLKPLRDSLVAQQKKLRESLQNVENVDKVELERIMRDYEETLERYEDELEEWQDELEEVHERHFEWNEKERDAFEENMEEWADKWEGWSEKWEQSWDEDKQKEWANKWKEWGEKWEQNWDEDKQKEWTEKWEEWGEKWEQNWDEDKQKEWAEKWEEWGEKWEQKWGQEWQQEWQQHQKEYEQKMREWEKNFEGEMKEFEFNFKEYEDNMREYEKELHQFENVYEDAMELEIEGNEKMSESNLKTMTSKLRKMLQQDGLVDKNDDQIKIKYDGKNAKVNGKTIPADKFNKYKETIREYLDESGPFTLSFSDKHTHISISGKNIDIQNF
ncbi:MAG: M56 family metallopeptidase [Chitinophagales bacterium]